MVNRPVVLALFIATALLCIGGSGLAAGERAVLAFQLPPAAARVEAAEPLCSEALDVAKILATPSLYAALLGPDPAAKREFDSTLAIRQQLEKYGHDTTRLAVRSVGHVAQCQTGCAVLPSGARIREIVMSDRHAKGGASITPAPRRPGDPQESPGSGAPSDRVNMGDFGYQGLQVTRGDRAVCVTAKNWSATEPSMQIVKIFFDR